MTCFPSISMCSCCLLLQIAPGFSGKSSHMYAGSDGAQLHGIMHCMRGRTSWKDTNSHGVVPRFTLARSAFSHLYCALQGRKKLTLAQEGIVHTLRLELSLPCSRTAHL